MTLSISPLNTYSKQLQALDSTPNYFADMQGKATKSDWGNLKPMSSLCEEFDVDWCFEPNIFRSFCIGSIPQEMEDKWFIYQEGNGIHFHRSWTGLQVWKCYFRPLDSGNQWQIYKVIACRDPNQYKMDKYDMELKLLKLMLPKMC